MNDRLRSTQSDFLSHRRGRWDMERPYMEGGKEYRSGVVRRDIRTRSDSSRPTEQCQLGSRSPTPSKDQIDRLMELSPSYGGKRIRNDGFLLGLQLRERDARLNDYRDGLRFHSINMAERSTGLSRYCESRSSSSSHQTGIHGTRMESEVSGIRSHASDLLLPDGEQRDGLHDLYPFDGCQDAGDRDNHIVLHHTLRSRHHQGTLLRHAESSHQGTGVFVRNARPIRNYEGV